MRYALTLSWKHLRARPVQSLIPLAVMALAIALTVAVLALGDGARRGIVRASDPFGVLVVGPKGDGQQLVLNSILLQGDSIGTIPIAVYDSLAADPRAQLVVPLAKGDNLGGAPIIGTNGAFFNLRTEVDAPPAFQVTQGRLFEADFEAVMGASAAEQLGIRIGDRFRAQHGTARGLESDMHEQVYTVVGILSASGTAYDSAIYVTYQTVWHVHEAPATDTRFAAGGGAGDPERLTSILVLPTGFAEQNLIWQEFYSRTDAQAVFPGQELGRLFDLLRQGEQILTAVGWLVFVIAALTVFLSIYSATLNREREIAIMRSLGSRRADVFRMILFEAVLLTVMGSLVGRIVGYGAALLIAQTYTQQSAIPIDVRYLTTLEPILWVVPLVIAGLAGLLPAVLAYRVDVAEKLTVV